MRDNIKKLEAFLGDNLDRIRRSSHPLAKVLKSKGEVSYCEDNEVYTTLVAFNYMLIATKKTKEFLFQKREDLISGDLKSQSATLAEIIAYYYLLEAGYKVEYQKTSDVPSADFVVTDSLEEKVIVEVRSRGICDEAAQVMDKKRADLEEIKESEKIEKVIRKYSLANQKSLDLMDIAMIHALQMQLVKFVV